MEQVMTATLPKFAVVAIALSALVSSSFGFEIRPYKKVIAASSVEVFVMPAGGDLWVGGDNLLQFPLEIQLPNGSRVPVHGFRNWIIVGYFPAGTRLLFDNSRNPVAFTLDMKLVVR
jgi:hypothetical protein